MIGSASPETAATAGNEIATRRSSARLQRYRRRSRSLSTTSEITGRNELANAAGTVTPSSTNLYAALYRPTAALPASFDRITRSMLAYIPTAIRTNPAGMESETTVRRPAPSYCRRSGFQTLRMNAIEIASATRCCERLSQITPRTPMPTLTARITSPK